MILLIPAIATPLPSVPDSIPPSVEVKQGVLYLGGNRMSGNMILTESDSGLVVNGLRLHPTRFHYPKSLSSNGDLVRDEMSKEARSIAESARRDSLPRDETLRLVRDNFQKYRIVASAKIQGSSILLRYRDTPIEDSWTLSDPIHVDPERRRAFYAWSRMHHLAQIKDYLEKGGLIVYPSTCLPADVAPRVDGAIQRLQRGMATSADKHLLRGWFPSPRFRTIQDEYDRFKHPLPLEQPTARLYPAGPIPDSLSAGRGVVYVGGHRLTGPFQFTTSESGLIVNGMGHLAARSQARSDLVGDSSREWARYFELRRIKDHLENGGVLLYSRQGIVYLQSQASSDPDSLIQRLQSGDASAADQGMRSRVPSWALEELEHPLPLEEIRRP